MDICIITPNGFTVGSADGHSRSYYYGLVSEAFERTRNGTIRNTERYSIIDTIKTLMHVGTPQDRPVSQWFSNQLENVGDNLTMLEFLSETLEYITTGHRSFPLASYFTLLNGERKEQYKSTRPSVVQQHSRHVRFTELSKRITSTIQSPKLREDLLYFWLSHPDGFSDMLYFFMIVLGTQGSNQNS